MLGASFQLRPDLDLIRAEAEDGRPALLVHDPVSGSFDRVEWPESDLVELLRERRTHAELAGAVADLSPRRADSAEIAGFVDHLGERGWLLGPGFWPGEYRPKAAPGVLRRLAGALFIQVPLVRPAAFLRKTAWLARAATSPPAAFAVVLAGLAGLYLALPRWEDYWAAGIGRFGWRELPAFYLALAFVKLAHELAHAYSATLAGARASAMGAAFIFLMPLPYTDVTDAWRLPWDKRLRVASAGMRAELALAGLAVFLWSVSPPGAAASALARISSAALFSTLLTNVNPGPRFDGYYMLVCLLRIENLRERGSAALREWLWRVFFGVRTARRDPFFSVGKRAGALAYAAYAIVYRLGLAAGLALMAYHFLPKALGVPAAAVELWALLGFPVFREAGALLRRRAEMRATVGMALALLAVAGCAAWVAYPWPRRIAVAAVAKPPVEEAVRTVRSGVVAEAPLERGMRVERGRVLLVMESPTDEPLGRRTAWAYREAAAAEEQSWRDGDKRREIGLRQADLERRAAEVAMWRGREGDLVVRAPADGTVADLDPRVRPGLTLPAGRIVAWIVDGPARVLSCYVDAADAARIDAGAPARFVPDDGSRALAGRIVDIGESRAEILEDAALAAELGATRGPGGEYRLDRPYVKMTVLLDGDAGRAGQTGRAWVWSGPESLLASAWDWVKAVAARESGF